MEKSSSPHANDNLFKTLVLILLVSTISQVTSDLYLPSLPHMATDLAVNAHWVQFSITLYMLGLCVSQLIYGPLSDAMGRRTPLIIGLILNFLGSLLCWMAPDIYLLYVGRCLQGLGGGASVALTRSILRDLFAGEILAKYNSYLAIASVFILALAPVLGGFIQYYVDWRANFAFLSGYGLIILVGFYYCIPETNHHRHPQNLQLKVISHNIKSLFASTTFIRYTVCTLLTYGGILAWLTATPIVLQEVVGFNAAQMGWVYVCSGFGFAVGALCNARLVWLFKIPTMIVSGFILQCIAGSCMLIFYLLGWINGWVIILPIGLYMLGSSFVFPNASAAAFGPFQKIAGTAGAVFGFLQIFGGVVASSIIALLPNNNQLPVALAFLTATVLSFIVYWGLKWENG